MTESKEEVVQRIYGVSLPQLKGVMTWFSKKSVDEQEELEREYYENLNEKDVLKYKSFQEWLFKNKMGGFEK